MKKFLFILLITLVFFTSVITSPIEALTKEETLLGPIIRWGKTVSITKPVNGDVFILGGKVTIDANIKGDLIILAGQVNVKGNIRDDLRIIAIQTDIKATVGDDLSLVTFQATIDPATIISNTALILSTQTQFSGQVNHRAMIYSSSIDLTKEATFKDDLKITYYQNPNISGQATISGVLTTKHSDKLNYQVYLDQLSNSRSKTVTKITFLVILQKLTTLTLEIFIGWILISLLPKISKDVSKIGLSQPSSTIGWGFIGFIITPLVGFLLLLTLIGIPLGVLVFVIYTASIYLAKLIGALNLGQQLTKKLPNFHKNLILGLIILSVLKLVPILGWLAYFIIILHGFGSLALLIASYFPKKNK